MTELSGVGRMLWYHYPTSQKEHNAEIPGFTRSPFNSVSWLQCHLQSPERCPYRAPGLCVRCATTSGGTPTPTNSCPSGKLALLGIYSVIAFSTALRTQEMAIRLALGSQRSSVMRLILVSGAKLGLAGCGIGAIAAVFATRLMRSLLFEVDSLDPIVLVLATVSILLLALAASVIPARRAASVEPMEALRTE